MAATYRSERDAMTRRIAKARRAKSPEASILFRGSFGSATASLRRFRLVSLLICLVSGCGHRKLFRSRKVKYGVVHRHVCFDFIDNNSLFVRCSFASGLD